MDQQEALFSLLLGIDIPGRNFGCFAAYKIKNSLFFVLAPTLVVLPLIGQNPCVATVHI
jgi:hypothetical protein